MADSPTPATWISKLRGKLNLSQASFGRQFGVSQKTVSRWESGILPRKKTLEKLWDLWTLNHTPEGN